MRIFNLFMNASGPPAAGGLPLCAPDLASGLTQQANAIILRLGRVWLSGKSSDQRQESPCGRTGRLSNSFVFLALFVVMGLAANLAGPRSERSRSEFSAPISASNSLCATQQSSLQSSTGLRFPCYCGRVQLDAALPLPASLTRAAV